jgi:hypothetical protein
MKTNENGLIIRSISVFKFSFLERWIGINVWSDGQSVGANVISWSKKINVRANVRPKKAAESFSNGSFKEP